MMMVVKMAFSFQAETRSAPNAMSARRWSIPCGTVAWGWIDSAHPVCCATYPRPPPRMYVWPTGSISLGFATIAAWITLESRCVCIFEYMNLNFILILYSNRGINFHVYINIKYIPCYCTVYLLFYVFMVCTVCMYECIYYVLRRRTVITWTWRTCCSPMWAEGTNFSLIRCNCSRDVYV